MNSKDLRIKELASFLDTSIDNIEATNNPILFIVDGIEEYLVCTDEEADQLATDYILDSLYCFNTDFIFYHSILNTENSDDNSCMDLIQTLQHDCNNKAILELIEDIDSFIQDAIISDGREHFIAFYDGMENIQGDFFIYRYN